MITLYSRPGPSMWAWGSPQGANPFATTDDRRAGKLTRPASMDLPDVLTGLAGLAILAEWMRQWR